MKFVLKLCNFNVLKIILNFSPAPQMQNVAGSYIPVSMAAAGQLKQDPNAATTNICKVKILGCQYKVIYFL